MNRITKSHVEAKIDLVNSLLGLENVEYSTVGSVHLEGAYGGYAVRRIVNTSGGTTDLSGGYSTLRESERFLSGMIAALRITRE